MLSTLGWVLKEPRRLVQFHLRVNQWLSNGNFDGKIVSTDTTSNLPPSNGGDGAGYAPDMQEGPGQRTGFQSVRAPFQ